MRYVRIPVPTGRALGNGEENSRQAKRDTVELERTLDSAHDIALSVSSKFSDLREKTERLSNEAARVGIKLNASKFKTLRTEYAKSKERTVVNGEQMEDIEDFVYLGAYVRQGRWRQ